MKFSDKIFKKSVLIGLIAYVFLSMCYVSCMMFSESPEDLNKEQNLLRCHEGIGVYDQKYIIASQKYKNASETERQAMLEAEFRSKVRNALFLGRSKDLAKTSVSAVTWFGLLHAFRNNPTIQQALGGGGFASYAAIAPTMRKTKELLSGLWSYYISADSASELNRLETEYVRTRPLFPLDLQATLDVTLNKAYCAEYKEQRADALEKVRIALAMPQKIKLLVFDDTKFNKLLGPLYGTTPTVLQDLKFFARSLARLSVASEPIKVNTYFYGPPAVGKTQAVKLIAKMFEIPYEIASLGSVNSLSDLIGSKGGGDFNEKPNPGILLDLLARHEPGKPAIKNKLIFFDDVDHILNADASNALRAKMLTLLESKTKVIENKYLGTDIDISRVVFILAGNTRLETNAIVNRLKVIEFPGYSIEYKKDHALKNLIPLYIRQYPNLTLSDLSPEDYKNIEKIIEEDAIVNPGFRELERKLQQYIDTKDIEKSTEKSVGPVEVEVPAFNK